MRFVKMHGAGNDYIYFDCFEQRAPIDPASLSRRVSHRHFGIGGDGIVLICPPDSAGHDARMRMFNADGSEAEMCGNAIRCVGKYLFDRGIVAKPVLSIETGRGPLSIELETVAGKVRRARVNMRQPILEAERIPTTLPGRPPILVPIEVDGRRLEVTCISMGNPHAILFVDEPTDDWVLHIGPQVETHPAFPRKTNVEFVQVLGADSVRMRVWERGSGETLACGTGACAVCVAGALTGRTGRKIVAELPGGELELEWAQDDCVYMTGPAAEVFQGEFADDGDSASPNTGL